MTTARGFRVGSAISRAIVVGLVGGCCGRLSDQQQATVDRWLLCDECIEGELDSTAALGDDAVCYLADRLARPPADRLENMRLQIGEHARRVERRTGADTIFEAEYIRRHLESYIVSYQSRSAIALGAIGTGKAQRALRNALRWDTLYRPEVLASIRGALASDLVIAAGDGQTAPVGSILPINASVRVTDRSGHPVEQIGVTFVVASGGGALTAPIGLSDTTGAATVGSWTLGATPGPQTLRAFTAADTVVFTATATARPDTILTANSILVQTAPTAAPVPVPPSVLVTDGLGNPVPARVVTFTVAAGNGSVTSATVTSDANGVATVGSWVLGPVIGADNRLAARSARVTTAPEFRATATRAPPVTMTVTAGNNQSAPVGTAVPVSPEVRVTDGGGDPVPGVVVGFYPVAGGGSVTGEIRTTGADGIARVGSWTLGLDPGVNRLRARSVGLPSVPFLATATVTPATLAIVSGNGLRTPVGTSAPDRPTVIVRDSNGDPVRGVAVRYAVVAGGGCIVVGGGCVANDTSTTAPDGTATPGSWRLGPATGVNRLRASVAGLAPVTFGDTATVAFASVSAGGTHTCAVTTDSIAYCWGSNIVGQLGDGSFSQRDQPTEVGGSLRFASVSAGTFHTCAQSTGVAAFCWGGNSAGQLGDSSRTNATLPMTVRGGLDFQSITAGGFHTCGVSVSRVYCWGDNQSFQLGDSAAPLMGRTYPARISSPVASRSVAGGLSHTCADSLGGAVYCWGGNSSGQLDGNWFGARRAVPIRVTYDSLNRPGFSGALLS